MPTSTVENYLKQIYIDQPTDEATMMPMGRLASAVGVTPGTATAMIKTMTESDLVVYEPRTGVRLSPEGESLALQVLRRHRLVELWLVKILGLDWSEVHEEAEVLEHAISDKVLARIDALRGWFEQHLAMWGESHRGLNCPLCLVGADVRRLCIDIDPSPFSPAIAAATIRGLNVEPGS